ncbi:MAG: CARDB domain-containing protein, partial [Ferruginibacter sp.]
FYPIKVWIDSANTLGEGNILNNYATRPVIVGNFTVPGTINVNTTATTDGCSKGKVLFRGTANYDGLNLAERPPVEGATVTITVLNYYGQPRVLTANTDGRGGWYVYDDPCAQDPNPEDCLGYLCGVTYNYTVQVTDFTLTSPAVSGTFNRPCVNCNPAGTIQHGGSVTGCILENQPYVHTVTIINYTEDFNGNKRCAPSVYNDTITVYNNGVLAYTYTLDSITSCGTASFTSNFNDSLPIGNAYNISYTHSYYTASGERNEVSVVSPYRVSPPSFDLYLEGVTKTGHKSFSFADINLGICGAQPGGMHIVYLYDSLPGYTEKVLIDSFIVNSIGATYPSNTVILNYSNPNWSVGYHYLTIITDATYLYPESNELNNILRVAFYVQEPDLIAKGISFSNSNVTTGSLINFLGNFKNTGAEVTQPFTFTFRANGVLVGTPINIPSINVNQSIEVVSVPFTVPTNPCPVEVTTFVDPTNVIQEFLETNNADTGYFGINIKAGRSCTDDGETIGAGFFDPNDVLGTSECFAYEAPKGRLTYFATTVKNTGTRDAVNIKVRFTLGGITIGNDVIPRINAGQKVESGFFYTFDTLGRFIVSAFADYDKVICEINETDNIGLIHIDAKPTSPDLEILSQYIAPSNLNPDPGQTITVVASIINKGTSLAKPSTVRFWVDNVRLGLDIPIDTLYAGEDTTVLATATYSSLIVGPKIIKVKADVFDKVLEKVEGNNEATRSIIVGGAPDYANSIHEAITITPATFAAGDSVTVSNYLRNYGAVGGDAFLKFRVVLNDGTDIIIDTIPFNLNTNDSGLVSLRWRMVNQPGMIITEVIDANPKEFNELNNFDTLYFIPGQAIPVTLISFNALRNGNNNVVNWKVATEYNLHHYEVERSLDGRVFESIFSTPAHNNALAQIYTYTDNNAWLRNSNSMYYRLRMVDNDGRFKFSAIVRLSNAPSQQITLAPNPVKTSLNVQIENNKAGLFTLQLLDAAAKQYLQSKHQLAQGSNSISIDVSNLAQGLYILILQDANGEIVQRKFIKE